MCGQVPGVLDVFVTYTAYSMFLRDDPFGRHVICVHEGEPTGMLAKFEIPVRAAEKDGTKLRYARSSTSSRSPRTAIRNTPLPDRKYCSTLQRF